MDRAWRPDSPRPKKGGGSYNPKTLSAKSCMRHRPHCELVHVRKVISRCGMPYFRSFSTNSVGLQLMHSSLRLYLRRRSVASWQVGGEQFSAP